MSEDPDMPVMREPGIYAGYVISLIGNNKGQDEEMPYHVAQGCVQSGTHRWAQDEQPMGKSIAGEIERQRVAREEETARDLAHAERLKAAGGSPKSVGDAISAAARPLHVVGVANEEGIFIAHLARPFPKVIEIDSSLINVDDGEGKDGFYRQDEKTLVIRLANGSAIYEIFDANEAFTFGALVEQELPEVDIPENWRERSHLVNIAAAKKLRGTSGSMTKVDGEAILEEWTRSDDPVSEEQPGAVETNESGRILDGNHDANPEGGDPAEKAKENEKAILNGDID